jgi:hypothetical protein
MPLLASALLCTSCAIDRPVPAPCPVIPPKPAVHLPAPGELTRDEEAIVSPSTSVPKSTSSN